jgi:DNA-binding CsgD family transcriptional regulator
MSVVSIGRQREREVLDRILVRAVRGQGGSVVVAGEAGIGKSFLLRSLAHDAAESGFDVRSIVGTPPSSQLPYAVLRRLLTQYSPINSADLDPVLSAIVGSASVSSPPVTTAVGTAFLMHISELAEIQPVLLIVDDIQWVDQSSAAALAFAARRLLADRVAIVFGHRSPNGLGSGILGATDDAHHDRTNATSFSKHTYVDSEQLLDLTVESRRVAELAGLNTLPVGPLTATESVELLTALGCDSRSAAREAPLAGGIPLALIELADQIQFGVIDEQRLALHLPQFYTEKIARLHPRVRYTLTAAALDDDLRAVLSVSSPSAITDLEMAEEQDIVRVFGERVLFRHPLLRAAALDASNASVRRQIHRTIAEGLNPQIDSDRYALHLSASAIGNDDVAAQALAAFALRARGRGAHEEAMDALLRASQLASNNADAARLKFEAGEAIYFGGDAERAITIAEQVLTMTDSSEIVSKADLLIANASMWERDPIETRERLRRVADSVLATDPVRSAWALVSASGMGFLAGDLKLGVTHGRRAEALGTEHGDMIAALSASGMISWNLFLLGQTEEAFQRMETIDPLVRMLIDQGTVEGVSFGQILAMRLIMQERFDEADSLLRQLLPIAQRLGVHLSVVLLSSVLGSLRWRQGRWEEALAYATQGLNAEELPSLSYAWACAAAAQMTASIGDVAKTVLLCGAVELSPSAAHSPLVTAWAKSAMAHLRLSQARPQDALAILREVKGLMDAFELGQPEFFLWSADYLEALLDCDERDEAAAYASELEEQNTSSLRWVQGVVARTRGSLSASGAEAEAAFAFGVSSFPFEIARTKFARARWRYAVRKSGLGSQSPDVDLVDATRTFGQLGASIWLARVNEFSSSAVSIEDSSRSHLLLHGLSDGELRVALAVSAGRANADVAQELFLSARTVEYHLTSIYKKLGVRNRQGLVALLRARTIR